VGGAFCAPSKERWETPIIEDLEQVLALRIFERDQAPVIEDEDVDACEAAQYRRIRAVPMGEREFRKQAWNATVDDAMPLTAGLLPEGTGARLADAGGSGDQDVLMLDDPATGRELTDQCPIELATAVVEIFDTPDSV
jgi:hypothetical protein